MAYICGILTYSHLVLFSILYAAKKLYFLLTLSGNDQSSSATTLFLPVTLAR
jgi:hypothetical protein